MNSFILARQSRWRASHFVIAVASVAVLFLSFRASAQYSEADVKAAFLAKFAAFVKWPAAGSSVTVGVLGDDPFGGALDKLIRVKRSRRAEDLKSCQIVFVSKSEQANVGAILGSLAGANILTVGDSPGFAKQGGVIGFVMEGDKVRFEISSRAARQAGLVIDVRLLRLAQRVYSE